MRRHSCHSSQMRRGKLTSHWIPPAGTAQWFLWEWVSASEDLLSGVGCVPWKDIRGKMRLWSKSTRFRFLLKHGKRKSRKRHLSDISTNYFKHTDVQSAISSGDNRVWAGVQVPLHHLILTVLPPCVYVLGRVPTTLQVTTAHLLMKVMERTASTGWNLSTLRATASLRSRLRMMWCPVIKSRKCRWIISFPRISSALKKTTFISTTW